MSQDYPSGEPKAASGAVPRVDLSRIRHELRTPINHILGYTEMLLEEGNLPASFVADLQRIHAGGRQLQTLIAEYFDDETFFQARDLHRLYHELRTPVNHIIGYSELLSEHAEEDGFHHQVADLLRIRDAAGHWLSLMEAYLIETPLPSESGAAGPGEVHPSATSAITLLPGVGFQVPKPRTTESTFTDEGAILIIDDDAANRDMLARRLRRYGYTVSAAPDGVQALRLARSQRFDLVLLDMIMPGLDGFQVLARFKSDPVLQEASVLMLSALDEENGIARCIEMGAEDYLAKPFNPVFLRARISACLEKKRLRDQERRAHFALVESQRKLAQELAEAAAYVRSLLPKPMTAPFCLDWRFVPCSQLGGDALDYLWLDDRHFAVAVIDVCGHGLSAAFLSISVLNVLRAQALPNADFCHPASVLAGLNIRFPMDRQNHMYFTIWYGVYCPDAHELVYASGGHPPAVLLTPERSEARQLQTSGPIVGFLPESQFVEASVNVPPGSRFYVFSDGAFELTRPDGRSLQVGDLMAELERPSPGASKLDQVLDWARKSHAGPSLEDDITIVEVAL